MDNRILPNDLARLIAERRHISIESAEGFVREFFRTVEEALKGDSIVKVKGLGTFKLVRVEPRESININTGQRFTIDGHTKITFTPDSALRSLVNKPFSEFETVVLNDDVDINELEAIGTEEEENEQEEVVESVVEQVKSDEVQDNKEVIAETESRVQNVAEPEVASQKNEDAVLTTENAGDEETNPVSTTPNPQTEQTTATQNVIEQHVAQQHITEQHVEHQTVSQQPIEMKEQNSARLTIWEALALMIFILALMAISYAAGYNRWLTGGLESSVAAPAVTAVSSPRNTSITTPSSEEQKNQNATSDVKKPAQTGPAKPVVPSKETLSKDYPQIPDGEYLIVGVKEEHKVTVGESLRGLAVKHYGSKDFVPYIVVMNDIKNPDILSLGITLKLPKLEKR